MLILFLSGKSCVRIRWNDCTCLTCDICDFEICSTHYIIIDHLIMLQGALLTTFTHDFLATWFLNDTTNVRSYSLSLPIARSSVNKLEYVMFKHSLLVKYKQVQEGCIVRILVHWSSVVIDCNFPFVFKGY